MQPAFSLQTAVGMVFFLGETGEWRVASGDSARRRLEAGFRGIFGGRGEEHLEGGDAILDVLGGSWDEAEGVVEMLEVALGAEAHGHFWKVEVAVSDAFCDHFFP